MALALAIRATSQGNFRQMSTSPAITFDTPIFGADGNQVITADTSVSFQWVPAAGNSYTSFTLSTQDGNDGPNAATTTTTGPSHASGYVTFNGVASIQAFRSVPVSLSFGFTERFGISLSADSPGLGNVYEPAWIFDPTTGVLDPQDTTTYRNNSIGASFQATAAYLGSSDWQGSSEDTEYGHWQLVPQVHNVDVFGGTGNDIILGGQGKEQLFGGTGDDQIRAGTGNDLVRGGTGNDLIYGGTGQQTLMGGLGDDTIWGGSGKQLLIGGNGQDMIHAGAGQQTVMGSTGNATLWGGAGNQVLEGGHGDNVLNAGSGNETLSGGTGRNTFVFSTLGDKDVITNFRPDHDIIEIAFGASGPTFTHLGDLLANMSADSHGNAALTIGTSFSLVIQHVSMAQVQAHLTEVFRLG